MVTERQHAILQAVLQQYVQEALPVSSQDIAFKLPFHVSSATIRSDMATLEEEGFLLQPHVSAGRVPTTRAFRLVAAGFLQEALAQTVSRAERARIQDPHQTARHIARNAGAISYVSIGHLPSFSGFEFVFHAPELRNEDALSAFAQLMDVAHEWEPRLREVLHAPLGIFIGKENPIFANEHFSVVAARLPQRGIVAILGPVRMDYQRAVRALLSFS